MKIRYSPILLSVALLFSSTAHAMSMPHIPIKLDDIKNNPAISGLATVSVLLAGGVLYLLRQVSTIKKEFAAKFSVDPNSRFMTFNANEKYINDRVSKLATVIGIDELSGGASNLVTRIEGHDVALNTDHGGIVSRLKAVEEKQQSTGANTNLGSSVIVRESNLAYIDEAIKKQVSALRDAFVTKDDFEDQLGRYQEVFVTKPMLAAYITKKDFEESRKALIAGINYNTTLSDQLYRLIDATGTNEEYSSAKTMFKEWKEKNKAPQL